MDVFAKKKKHSNFKFQKFEMIDEGSHLTDDAPVELKKKMLVR